MVFALRYIFLKKLFEWSVVPYRFLFKRGKKEWGVSRNELLSYEKSTLGRKIGEFLKQNGFELIDHMESHDVYHLLTSYPTSMRGEIAMQFFLLGNGKRSIYQFGVITLGGLLYPEKYFLFRKAFLRGKSTKNISTINYFECLDSPFKELKVDDDFDFTQYEDKCYKFSFTF